MVAKILLVIALAIASVGGYKVVTKAQPAGSGPVCPRPPCP